MPRSLILTAGLIPKCKTALYDIQAKSAPVCEEKETRRGVLSPHIQRAEGDSKTTRDLIDLGETIRDLKTGHPEREIGRQVRVLKGKEGSF